MKCITTFVALAVFFTCGFTYAEEEPSPIYKHLKPLEWAVGEWVCEFPMPNDFPGLGKKGEPFKSVLNCQWGLNKSILMVHETSHIGGRNVWDEKSVFAWDGEAQKIIVYGFGRGGYRSEGTIAAADASGHTTNHRGVGPDGKAYTYNIVMKLVNEDAVTRRRTGIGEEGSEEKVDWLEIELKRTK